MSQSPTPASSWRRKLALLAVSSLSTLAVAELVCRVQAQRRNLETFAAALRRPQELSHGDTSALADIIQPNRDDRIAYELRPNLQAVPFKGASLTSNSRGFRSPELGGAQQTDAITIVGIGDSIMFGHGVEDAESYLPQLRELLAGRYPALEWRVVNTGVPGYNTVMEVQTLVAKCLDLKPDLVVLGVVGNDYAPPQYLRTEEDVFDLGRSFFLDFLRRRGADPASHAEALTHADEWRKSTGAETGSAPPRYAELYGREPFAAALDRLAELSRQHGFEVLAFATNDYLDTVEMMEACEQRGFQRLHLQADLERHFEESMGRPFEWGRYKDSDLVVSPGNLHPSVLQHAMAAEKLFTKLEQTGLLEGWTASR